MDAVRIGHMMFHTADTTGEFTRYRWSVNPSKTTGTYDIRQRPVAAARIV